MRKALMLGATLVVGSLAVACGKAPAQAALKAADLAIEAARPELERYVPQEFKSLADASKAAHDKFTQGDYAGALTASQALPAKVQAAVAAAQAKKEELARTWTDLQAAVPGLLEAATTRVVELSTRRRLPAGLDKTRVAGAKTELDAIAQTWTETTASYQKGDVLEAVAKARTVKARLEGLTAGLGMSGAAPVPAPPAH